MRPTKRSPASKRPLYFSDEVVYISVHQIE
jgi:hypothetical protein